MAPGFSRPQGENFNRNRRAVSSTPFVGQRHLQGSARPGRDVVYDPLADGDVPWWDGNTKYWAEYVIAVQRYVQSTKKEQRESCGARLIRRLRKTARKAVKRLKPTDVVGEDGWKALLRFLESAVATEPGLAPRAVLLPIASEERRYHAQLHSAQGADVR